MYCHPTACWAWVCHSLDEAAERNYEVIAKARANNLHSGRRAVAGVADRYRRGWLTGQVRGVAEIGPVVEKWIDRSTVDFRRAGHSDRERRHLHHGVEQDVVGGEELGPDATELAPAGLRLQVGRCSSVPGADDRTHARRHHGLPLGQQRARAANPSQTGISVHSSVGLPARG